ncbi:MAG: hypothetical protein GXO90_11050 [FCB group bacterium]|nr:hypothetical protein [FCB group bacterium]
MISVIIVGILVLGIGIAYLFFPRLLLQLSQWANQIIFRDDIFIKKNRATGAGLIIAGLWLLWIYFHRFT